MQTILDILLWTAIVFAVGVGIVLYDVVQTSHRERQTRRTLRGWYSCKQASLTGTVVWARPDGTEVEISCAMTEKPPWDDVVDRGEVSHYVRGQLYPLRMPGEAVSHR